MEFEFQNFPAAVAFHSEFSGFHENNFYFCRVDFVQIAQAMQRRYRTVPDLKKHECARAISFANPELAGKLTSMGVLPGANIEMVRRAPFGNAFYIKVDGVRLALREEEAASILLEI